ncbi:piggyBac transposable element-derived protein 4-like [Mantella aurantiaca]
MNDSDSDAELLAELSDSESWVYSSSDTDTDTDLSSDDSDDSAELSDVRTWCSIDCDTDQAAPPRFQFTGAPGMKVDVEHDNPLAYLQLFLTDEVIEKIVTETNRYKEQQSATLYRKFSRIRKWEPVTKNDIWNFLGLIILQGVVKKPLQKWYWSTNKLLETPFFGTVMTEYRFSLIMKFLHFTNNEEFDETTHPAPKLKKIWEVFQMVVKNFKQTYVPERDISIDESLMAYKGRFSWIQYIASKRARFGIKSYMLYVCIIIGIAMPLLNKCGRCGRLTCTLLSLTNTAARLAPFLAQQMRLSNLHPSPAQQMRPTDLHYPAPQQMQSGLYTPSLLTSGEGDFLLGAPRVAPLWYSVGGRHCP